MAHGSHIRRIGKYMRAHGADGSLVAWVEAELDRLDLQAIEPSDLQPLREDLTVRERELIVAATLHLASAAHPVRTACGMMSLPKSWFDSGSAMSRASSAYR